MDPTKILQYIQLVQALLQLWAQMQPVVKSASPLTPRGETDMHLQIDAINKQLAALLQ